MSNLLNLLKLAVTDLLPLKRLNQAKLAELIDVKPQQLSRQLGGKSNARISLLEDIAQALEVPAFYLLMTESERALWDSKASNPIERRLELLERQISELTSKSPAPQPQDSLPALEALAQEMQRVIGDQPLKKHDRKKGNG